MAALILHINYYCIGRSQDVYLQICRISSVNVNATHINTFKPCFSKTTSNVDGYLDYFIIL